jgi:aminopeptidase N
MSPVRRSGRRLAVLGALVAIAALALAVALFLWRRDEVLDSGGPLAAEQAAYDVRRYELAFTLEPERRRIAGDATATVVAREPLAELVLDLDRRLAVARVEVDGRAARFTHRSGRLRVALDPAWAAGERHAARVRYAGRPKRSRLPPWLDGFVWAETDAGEPWIGVTVQGDGADDFWPTKDHPSDEPDEGVAIELTVPAGSVGLANGRRTAERANPDGTVTSRWEVSYPINNYLVTLAAGPYVEVVERYRGADGTLDVPMRFWVLPEHVEPARRMWREAAAALPIFARRFGEFPFLADKIGAVEAPFDGMEHQTLLALGDGLEPYESGVYETLVHELAHEWWGNQVTARDWDDFWIHEGFSTWAEALYLETRFDADRARGFLEEIRAEIENREPLVAGRPRTAAEAYGHEIYAKGAWVLVSLRWQLGDDAFFRVVRRFAGESGEPRLVDSAELAAIAEAECACELDAFWERYLRRAAPPRYSLERTRAADRDRIRLAWDDPALELALPVRVGGELRRVEMPGGSATFEVPAGLGVAVESRGRLLAQPAAGAE